MTRKRANTPALAARAETYQHPEATAPLWPEIGAQSRFQKAQPLVAYRYDGSLSLALEWGGWNPARDAGESLIAEIPACGLQIAELAEHAASKEREAEIQRLRGVKVIDPRGNELLVVKKLEEKR